MTLLTYLLTQVPSQFQETHLLTRFLLCRSEPDNSNYVMVSAKQYGMTKAELQGLNERLVPTELADQGLYFDKALGFPGVSPKYA